MSGTLIQIPGHGSILLDCGEGTWGQLARTFGDDPARASGVWHVLRDLKCIFLSHMHGDHHMGVSKILQTRAQVRVAAPYFAYASFSTQMRRLWCTLDESASLGTALRRRSPVTSHVPC